MSYQRVLLQTDFDRFAKLTGDDNPIHCDPEFAAKTHFGATVAHGMMLYSDICKALTEQVGPGVVQLEQTLIFPNPTYVGDRLRIDLHVDAESAGLVDVITELAKVGADGTVVATATGKELVNLATRVSATDGRTICDGEALMLVRNLKYKLENRLENKTAPQSA